MKNYFTLLKKYRLIAIGFLVFLVIIFGYRLLIKRKTESPEIFVAGSGSVDLTLAYKGQASTYIPSLNDTFDINVIVNPNGKGFIGGTMVISYNKNELEYVGSTVLQGLSAISDPVVGSIDNQTNVIRTSLGYLNNSKISVQSPIFEIKFRRIANNENTIGFISEEIKIATEESATNDLRNLTNLVVKKKEDVVSSGFVNLALVYREKPSTYIPSQNEIFEVDLMMNPNGKHFIGGELAVGYNKDELQFEGGNIAEGLDDIVSISVTSLDNQTDLVKTSVGILSSNSISVEKSIFKLRFKRLGVDQNVIRLITDQIKITTEESETNDLGTATNLTINAVSGVNNNPPICTKSTIPPETGSVPLTVTLHGSGNSGSGVGIAGYIWDFDGNGTFDTTTPNINSVSYTYTTAGTYRPLYKVVNTNGIQSEACIYQYEVTATSGNTNITYVLIPSEKPGVININIGTSYGLNVFLTKLINNNNEYIFDLNDFEFRWNVVEPNILNIATYNQDECTYSSGTFRPCPNMHADITGKALGDSLVMVDAYKKSENRVVANISYYISVKDGDVSSMRKVKFGFHVLGLDNRPGLKVKGLLKVKSSTNLGETFSEEIFNKIVDLTYSSGNYYVTDEYVNIDKSIPYIDVYMKGERHLARIIRNNSFADSADTTIINFPESILEPGDLPLPETNNQQDGKINSLDLNYLIQNWGSTDPNIVKVGDVNYDGKINSADTVLVVKTLSTKSDER